VRIKLDKEIHLMKMPSKIKVKAEMDDIGDITVGKPNLKDDIFG